MSDSIPVNAASVWLVGDKIMLSLPPLAGELPRPTVRAFDQNDEGLVLVLQTLRERARIGAVRRAEPRRVAPPWRESQVYKDFEAATRTKALTRAEAEAWLKEVGL